MSQPRCPGQDQRYWKPDDIFNVACPFCAAQIEFWKDEPVRCCPECKREVRNPKLDAGCAEWCRHSDECLGRLPDEPKADQNAKADDHRQGISDSPSPGAFPGPDGIADRAPGSG